MDNEIIKNNYIEEIKRIIGIYVLDQQRQGRDVNEINPWQVLAKDRLRIAETVCDNTDYPMTIEGTTTGLIIIENILQKVYGTKRYMQYFHNTPQETRVDDLLREDAKKYVQELVDDGIEEGAIFDQVLAVWLRTIDNYKQYLTLKLVRNNMIAKVQVRAEGELIQYLHEATDKLLYKKYRK
ncbi:MAG: hypothetical protein U9Q12_00120 [Patescibacteria group bacterium]|nr:hypothetical protein [Patescibacteria group bacterium]